MLAGKKGLSGVTCLLDRGGKGIAMGLVENPGLSFAQYAPRLLYTVLCHALVRIMATVAILRIEE